MRTLHRLLGSITLLATLSAAACKSQATEPAAKPAVTAAAPAAGSAAPAAGSGAPAAGPRRVAIDAGPSGYKPDRIEGAPGEALTLVFTRTANSECIAELKTPDGKTVPLPLDKPVEVAVTVPATGQVGFACGMDMYHGVVVAKPAT